MRSIILFIAAMAFLVAGCTTATNPDYTKVTVEKRIYTTNEDSNTWVGTVVRNSDDDDIGTIKEFVTDSDGRVSFAIISPSRMIGLGDREIVVPYNALAFNPGRDYVYLDITTDRLAGAPRLYDKARLMDRPYEVQVYRYYGQRPYWTEHEEREVTVEKHTYTTKEDVNAWVGRVVRNSDNDDIGTIKEFVTDSAGRVSFAIISPSRMMGFGDREIVVPFSALAFNPGRAYVYLDITTDRLARAPRFDDRARLKDRSYEVEVYRYYGQRPYWSYHERGERE
jgi:hypothetical protein